MAGIIYSIRRLVYLVLLLCSGLLATAKSPKFYAADHPYFRYMGRIDFSNAKLPRFWQPAVNVSFRFSGSSCRVILHDEVLWGKNHNYIEIILDGKAVRLQTKSATDTITAGAGLSAGVHTVIICKNTEANIGYLEFVGALCDQLIRPLPVPAHKIECIGNSITCGASSDESTVPCGKGVWHDQHNAWMSYASITGRNLKAQYHLSSVSGIGLMHSCCNLEIIMPQVFDKVSMRENKIDWDFSRYQPDVVTCCLGQNDGIQDSAAFCTNYIAFIKTVRSHYPKAMIVLLSSPMADSSLRGFMKKVIPAVEQSLQTAGDKNICHYIFEKQYSRGCDWHPSVKDHQLIAEQLTAFIRRKMRW